MRGHDTVVHLASNADIARAATDPSVDLYGGTLLTHHVLEAVRLTGARQVLYASGSGVYGDTGGAETHEDHGPLLPVSTYGASKLAGEALLSAYCAMFGVTGAALRFANVVGPHQTHGVGYDFVRHLLDDPTRLRILGDGTQTKSYLHVDDVVDALLLVGRRSPSGFSVFNVATRDHMSVKEIADLAVECVVPGAGTVYEFSGGSRGWQGDVPVIRLDTSRIRALGWSNRRSSSEALRDAIVSMADDARAGRLS
jgi:UDP-glucose 4-epimerase